MSSKSVSKLKHMPGNDITTFGKPCEFSGLNLPTKQDVLRYYFFLAERAKKENKMFSYKTFTPIVADKLIEIWSKIDCKIINRKSIQKKLISFLDRYRKENKSKAQESFKKFVKTTKEIFYIGKCQCDLVNFLCTCGLITEYFKVFMMDQFNERQYTIAECFSGI